MEYPYDIAEFSPFTRAYLELLRKQPLRAQPVGFLLDPIGEEFPAAGAALLHTLAHHCFRRADLGWRELSYRGDDEDIVMMGSWDNFNVGDDAPNLFDCQKALLLGESSGGEVYFGIHWDRGGVRYFEVDVEDELGEPIKEFETADDFWAFIRESESDYAEMEGSEPPLFLVDLYAAAGQPFGWPN
jgi:hypothetical protein